MRSRPLVWKLCPSFVLVTLLALLLGAWLFSRALRDFYMERTAADLEARARLVAAQVRDRAEIGRSDDLDDLSKRLGGESRTRITLILPSGKVVGDSEESPARMGDHADRPEVAAARAGRVGMSVRYSNTLGTDMMYVAVPVSLAGGAGAVRTALPMSGIDRMVAQVYRRIASGGFLVILTAVAVSIFISRRIGRPLEEMRRGAERFAVGDLSQRLSVGGAEEIGALAAAMNRMAVQLDERMRTVVRQRNEQEAVLASMVEGVLAVDTEERILRLNGAAASLLGVNPEEAQGRPIQETVRKADLQRFVARALASREAVEGDIVLRDAEERHLQAHGTVLRGADGQRIGALVVLNDITRLRRLESIRRDFVANVSHELKTPITAIKGFVETLLDGALENPEDARRFLSIIIRQADRLNAIIEDLLELSRIEQYAEKNEIPLEEESLEEVLRSVSQACAIHAAARQISLQLEVPPDLRARINPPLLEQAVINLVDNAVKYSESGGKVLIQAVRAQDEVLIRVRDWGAGIAREHLPRLFERFYRVDKARSRKVGGTGLGLAIVKHIVQAHGGKVSVQSTPGEGSVFTIALPRASDRDRTPRAG